MREIKQNKGDKGDGDLLCVLCFVCVYILSLDSNKIFYNYFCERTWNNFSFIAIEIGTEMQEGN